MKKLLPFLVFFVLCHSLLFAQTKDKVEVMTLGTFHFDFPNLDAEKIKKKDQIDVLKPKYQAEIKAIVHRLAAFNPTIIAIERMPRRQAHVDSLYQLYKKGEDELSRSETQQIGFRLAKKLNLDKLYAVDARSRHYLNVKKALNDSTKRAQFAHYYFNNPDTSMNYSSKNIFATEGILAQLKLLNDSENIKKSLGDYLIGHFKFEFEKRDFFGVDFETGRWFNRNLRIFRNIQRIKPTENDRILLIIGAGHLNLLNIFFKASPEYKLVSPLKYLD